MEANPRNILKSISGLRYWRFERTSGLMSCMAGGGPQSVEGGWINGDKGGVRVCGLNGCDMIRKNGEMVAVMSPNKFRCGG